ncbi:NAD(P)-dependent oxidoreductase [Streptomyces chiangmaiensis]
MQLTIFAASGGIGRHLLEQAEAAGHDVTAVVRDPQRLTDRAGRFRVVTADLAAPDADLLASAVGGRDAVLSGLGPRHPKSDAGITSRGTKAIVAAMQATGVRRLVVVSAAPVGTVPSPGRPHPRNTIRATGSSCATWADDWPAPCSARTMPTSH